MEFRKATLKDLDALVKLRIEFMKEVNGTKSKDDDEKYGLLAQTNAEYFKKHLPDNSFIAWLAVDQGEIIGTSGLVFYDRPPSYKNLTGKNAYIMNIYTLEAYRKKGIASLLLEKTVNEAFSLGYSAIYLNATDMGKPLYLKHGFKDVNGEMVLMK